MMRANGSARRPENGISHQSTSAGWHRAYQWGVDSGRLWASSRPWQVEHLLRSAVPMPRGIINSRHSPAGLHHTEQPIARYLADDLGDRCAQVPPDRDPGSIGKTAKPNLPTGASWRRPARSGDELKIQ